MREPDNWCILDTCPNLLAAEVDAGLLRSEGLTARVEPISDIPGLDQGARLWVDAACMGRARLLLRAATVSEAELEHLAMEGPSKRAGDSG